MQKKLKKLLKKKRFSERGARKPFLRLFPARTEKTTVVPCAKRELQRGF
jgi:hypothetical protein